MAKYDGIDPRKKLHPEEPYFFLRAQDKNSVPTLIYYLYECEAGQNSVSEEFLDSLENLIAEFRKWQEAHPDRVKQPD